MKKFFATSKWQPFWKCPNIKHSFNLTSGMKRSSQIMQEKNIFIVMMSSMTSQSDLKVVSLYSFMNDKITFFMITEERTNKDIIFKLSVHMYHWNVNMRLQAILEYFVDDVIRSQNKSKLWTTIALSKYELEKRSTAQNVANWTGYQKFKFQFHIQISKVWQVSNLRLPFHFICFFLR